MAKIIVDDQEREVPDNQRLVDILEEMGVMISCSEGLCGTCEIEVIEGEENLKPKSDEETTWSLEPRKRLGCQITIKSGTVKILNKNTYF